MSSFRVDLDSTVPKQSTGGNILSSPAPATESAHHPAPARHRLGPPARRSPLPACLCSNLHLQAPEQHVMHKSLEAKPCRQQMQPALTALFEAHKTQNTRHVFVPLALFCSLMAARTAASVSCVSPSRLTSSKPLNRKVACRSPLGMHGALHSSGPLPMSWHSCQPPEHGQPLKKRGSPGEAGATALAKGLDDLQ